MVDFKVLSGFVEFLVDFLDVVLDVSGFEYLFGCNCSVVFGSIYGDFFVFEVLEIFDVVVGFDDELNCFRIEGCDIVYVFNGLFFEYVEVVVGVVSYIVL